MLQEFWYTLKVMFYVAVLVSMWVIIIAGCSNLLFN